jgi:hypothetical protein
MSVVAAVGPGAAVAAYGHGHGQPLCGGGARKRKDVRDHEVGLPGSDGRAAARRGAGLFVLETVEEEEEEEGADAERSSSVGAASEDDAEDEEEEDGDEVDSGGTRWTAGRRREGGALEAAMDMGALDDALPIK